MYAHSVYLAALKLFLLISNIDGFCSFMHFGRCKRINPKKKKNIKDTQRKENEKLLIKELYVFIGYLAL